MDIMQAKETVIRAGKELIAAGLIARTWGNISCRIMVGYKKENARKGVFIFWWSELISVETLYPFIFLTIHFVKKNSPINTAVNTVNSVSV